MITINARGARTLADTKPLTYGGKGVYITIDGDTAELHVAGTIVDRRPAANVVSTRDGQDWAYDIIDAISEAADPAVNDIRAEGADLDQVADGLARFEGPFRSPSGRHVPDSDPRHPHNAAKTYKKQAAALMSWTAGDEAGYGRYVLDGLADTDGWFMPVSRADWKLDG